MIIQQKQSKRRRGRPTGPQIDDTTVLTVLARRMFAGRSRKPMGVIGQLLSTSHEGSVTTSRASSIRRIFRKWVAQKPELMAQAEAWQNERPHQINSTATPTTAYLASDFARRQDTALMRAARLFAENLLMIALDATTRMTIDHQWEQRTQLERELEKRMQPVRELEKRMQLAMALDKRMREALSYPETPWGPSTR